MRRFNTNVDRYFTFKGCGKHLELGETCQLGPKGRAPVRVIAVATTGFAFLSLRGHVEGAGRTIRFEFQPFPVIGNATLKRLVVDAWGPVSGLSSLRRGNSDTIAEISWRIFANKINSLLPDEPPPENEA